MVDASSLAQRRGSGGSSLKIPPEYSFLDAEKQNGAVDEGTKSVGRLHQALVNCKPIFDVGA